MKPVLASLAALSILAAAGCAATDTAPAEGAGEDAGQTASSDSGEATVADGGGSATEDGGASTTVDGGSATSDGGGDAEQDAGEDPWSYGEVVDITLEGTSISLSANAGSSASVSGTTVTIHRGGTYRVTGPLSDGQLVVASADENPVSLLLNGVDITTTSSNAPIDIEDAKDVFVVLAEGSTNTLTDDSTYVLATGADEPNATLYSKADLTIVGDGDGSGQLVINARYNDGIGCKDELVLENARITVNATVDDGIRGKDSIVARGSTVVVNAKGDGLVSDNTEDAAKGFIQIESGSYTVVSGTDALQAETSLVISGGTFDLTTGGGANATLGYDVSAKGLKGLAKVLVSGGSFDLDCADDAIHSNAEVVIDGGSFAIRTGDDGVHSDADLTVNDGDLQVTKSYEGLEAATMTLNGGTIRVVTSDDGINVAGGVDGSGGFPGSTSSSRWLHVNGGSITVDSVGDGVDVNGSAVMTGGSILVNGPSSSANAALDYDGTFLVSGGVIVAAGASGMAQAPSTGSSQRSVKITYGTSSGPGGPGGPGGGSTSGLATGTLFQLRTSAGVNLLAVAPTRTYQSVVFSSPAITSGLSLSVYTGGSCTDTAVDGLHDPASCTGGTLRTTFTSSSVVTSASFQ